MVSINHFFCMYQLVQVYDIVQVQVQVHVAMHGGKVCTPVVLDCAFHNKFTKVQCSIQCGMYIDHPVSVYCTIQYDAMCVDTSTYMYV